MTESDWYGFLIAWGAAIGVLVAALLGVVIAMIQEDRPDRFVLMSTAIGAVLVVGIHHFLDALRMVLKEIQHDGGFVVDESYYFARIYYLILSVYGSLLICKVPLLLRDGDHGKPAGKEAFKRGIWTSVVFSFSFYLIWKVLLLVSI